MPAGFVHNPQQELRRVEKARRPNIIRRRGGGRSQDQEEARRRSQSPLSPWLGAFWPGGPISSGEGETQDKEEARRRSQSPLSQEHSGRLARCCQSTLSRLQALATTCAACSSCPECPHPYRVRVRPAALPTLHISIAFQNSKLE